VPPHQIRVNKINFGLTAARNDDATGETFKYSTAEYSTGE